VKSRNRVELDVAIVGGGVAGLWLLNVLVARGHSTALFEAGALGGGQTLASQGIIHGGVKYALGGVLTSASTALAPMPDRWRACLAGRGEIDLSSVVVASDRCYLWSNASALGAVGTWLSSRFLRGRVEALEHHDYPDAFRSCTRGRTFAGRVYALHEPVVDVASLVAALARPHRERIAQLAVTASALRFEDGALTSIATDALEIRARHFVLAAGVGNEALLRDVAGAPPMQRRPLQQVVVRHPNLPSLYGHCIGDLAHPEPRLTITTHDSARGRCWYFGGRLATGGAERDAHAQVAAARRELVETVPWLDLSAAELTTRKIDRAEPATVDRSRPDAAFARRIGNVVVAWPTKLSLAPDLGDRVLALLGEPTREKGATTLSLASPPIATPPWA